MRTLIAAVLIAAAVPAGAAPCSSVVSEKWSCLTGPAAQAKPDKVVVKDPAAWQAFWNETAKPGAAPAVDFKTEAVAVTFAADAQGRPTFAAVKVARGTDDKTAVLAAAAVAGSDAEQKLAAERAGRVLGTLSVARRDDGGVFAPAGNLGSFDGRAERFGLRDAVASQGAVTGMPGLIKVQLSCTPGVDCPEQARPAPRPRQPDCTPGVDCPDDDGRGNDNGRTPLPPNYRPRPDGAPSSFPPIGNPSSYNDTVASGWYLYRNDWGQIIESNGDWSDYGNDRARVERGGSEVGAQGTSYTASLESKADRPVYRLFWRYVGYNCDPNDSSRCLDWRVQYARYVDRWDHRSAGAVVDVRFNDNGQKLLPWEKETIYVTFDGYRVGYDASSYAAFRYAVNGPVINQQTGRASVEFIAGERIKRQPESDKVVARLEKGGAQLQITVLDRRAAFYDGEPLDVAYQVKKDCNGIFCFDKVVSERNDRDPVRAIVSKGSETQIVIPIPAAGSGKYYISSISFRRAQSKISSDGWVGLGRGPKVQY